MTTARQHHYIPKFYLNGFTAAHQKKPKVFVYDLEKNAWLDKPTNIKNIGTIRDFNRVDVQGHAPDALEKSLSSFEADISKALRSVCESDEMPLDDDLIYLMNLMTLISIRNPRVRKNHDRFIKNIVEQTTALTLATKDRFESSVRQMKAAGHGVDLPDVSYEDVLKFHNEKQYTIEINNGMFVAGEFKAFDTVVKLLWKRNWIFVKAAKDAGHFVTSDHPVHLRWSDPKLAAGFLSPGHGVAGTEVIFPVSKDTALVGRFEGEERTITANRHLVALINSLTIKGCDRQVYSSQDDFEVLMAEKQVVSFTSVTKSSKNYADRK